MLAIDTAAIFLGLYVALLFAIAAWGDRHARRLDARPQVRAWLYALALGVYCTSWTFYGAVGEAARHGWDYLPIYLGPAALFLFGFPIIRRLVRLGREYDTGSIADFLSARYGKSAGVAGLATGILVVAAIPYLSLQLRSTETSFTLLTAGAYELDWAFLLAIAFAAFAVLFGARHTDTARGNRGLVVAIAFESAVKLTAMVAIGGFAVLVWNGLDAAERTATWQASRLAAPELDLRFIVLTLLAGLAALCLPRQFHMMVVEARKVGDERVSRFAFPAYLALVAIIAPPVALAGATLGQGLNPDVHILALPLSANADPLAILAFIGGFSASAGMITVTALALSTMTIDAMVAPALIRRGLKAGSAGLASTLLNLRRIAILAMLLLAYQFHRGLDTRLGLADIGLVAFAGIAQLGPALLFGLFWRRANRIGAICGMGTGGLVWLGLVLIPAYSGYRLPVPDGLDAFSVAVLASLVCNTLVFIIAVAFTPSRLADRLQAEAFTGGHALAHDTTVPNARLADLEALLVHVLGEQQAAHTVKALCARAGRDLLPNDVLTRELTSRVEARLARAVGTAAARILIAQVLPGDRVSPTDVVTLLDETTEKIRNSQSALAETERSIRFYTDNVPALITFADRDERLQFANRSYLDFFGLSRSILGRRIGDYLSAADYAQRRPHIAAALSGKREVFDINRPSPDGSPRTWQVIYQPRIENGEVVGFFGVYQDITARRQAEEGLRKAYETLEEKVHQRTAALEAEAEARLLLVRELEIARAQAEAATQSKTRFLAAASHDLLQPLSAARLLASALGSELKSGTQESRALLDRIDQSIENADRLIRALLDISRLDAGGVTPEVGVFPLDALMAETTASFREAAAAKGISLDARPTRLWVRSDRGLMTSVLQNLISNAVRYTQTGGVHVEARLEGDAVLLEVADTGPGIPPDLRTRIFREFERGGRKSDSDRGLGLGLAIVDRILTCLGHTIAVRESPSGGSVFCVQLPRAEPAAVKPSARPGRKSAAALDGVRILCIDNDRHVLDAMTGLLTRWGCEVRGAVDQAGAETVFQDTPPDLVVVDFLLDDDIRGPDVYACLCKRWGRMPPGLLATAERSEESIRAAATCGLELLYKPVPPAVLRASLGAVRARSKQAAS